MGRTPDEGRRKELLAGVIDAFARGGMAAAHRGISPRSFGTSHLYCSITSGLATNCF